MVQKSVSFFISEWLVAYLLSRVAQTVDGLRHAPTLDSVFHTQWTGSNLGWYIIHGFSSSTRLMVIKYLSHSASQLSIRSQSNLSTFLGRLSIWQQLKFQTMKHDTTF